MWKVVRAGGDSGIGERLKEFYRPIPQHLLNIEGKNRSNLFAWRGQFSPQLVECLLEAYCPREAVVLDPFLGSGTVLLEAATLGLPALGYEINPSAWSFSKVYEFANLPHASREQTIAELHRAIEVEFPIIIFRDPTLALEEVETRIVNIGKSISSTAKILCNALVVLLDVYSSSISSDLVQNTFLSLSALVRRLIFSPAVIRAGLQDARSLPIERQSVDFVLTSPPYINVFNYHQNYRRSVELLGWDVLRVARSEIGSNRANRGNRFYTVVQYCIDMARTLQEIARVLRPGGRAVLVVGYESNVLGVPFYNAEIVRRIALESGMFDLALCQQRVFQNRFGRTIREDILNLNCVTHSDDAGLPKGIGRTVAYDMLDLSARIVPESNRMLLQDALSKVEVLEGTPLFNGTAYTDYQTRSHVMMVNERTAN